MICFADEDRDMELPLVRKPKWEYMKAPNLPVVGYVTLIGQFAIGYMDVVFTIHLKEKFVSDVTSLCYVM